MIDRDNSEDPAPYPGAGWPSPSEHPVLSSRLMQFMGRFAEVLPEVTEPLANGNAQAVFSTGGEGGNWGWDRRGWSARTIRQMVHLLLVSEAGKLFEVSNFSRR